MNPRVIRSILVALALGATACGCVGRAETSGRRSPPTTETSEVAAPSARAGSPGATDGECVGDGAPEPGDAACGVAPDGSAAVEGPAGTWKWLTAEEAGASVTQAAGGSGASPDGGAAASGNGWYWVAASGDVTSLYGGTGPAPAVSADGGRPADPGEAGLAAGAPATPCATASNALASCLSQRRWIPYGHTSDTPGVGYTVSGVVAAMSSLLEHDVTVEFDVTADGVNPPRIAAVRGSADGNPFAGAATAVAAPAEVCPDGGVSILSSLTAGADADGSTARAGGVTICDVQLAHDLLGS